MRSIVLFAALGVLTGCSTYQVTPTSSSPGAKSVQVDVLFSPPSRPYKSVGIVSAKRYKPGWTDPTTSDAIPQIKAAGAQVGADAVIVKSTRALGDRHIVVEGEAIQYTDVADFASHSLAEASAAAQGFSSDRGCGAVSVLTDNNGVTLFQAQCPAGATLIVECRVQECSARN